ncbi:MAG: hypothetical protein ACRBFS_01645 [Aureispira sp.]
MAILPPTSKQPIYVQPVVPPVVQQAPTKPIVIKHINWSHKQNAAAINPRSTNALPDRIHALTDSIRVDLAKLRQLHRAIMEAVHFDTSYKKNNANKEQEYTDLLKRVNELSRQPASQEIINELQIIEDQLELDCANIDTMFPQMVYKATYMESLMAIRVELIGYVELKAEALAALKGIRSAKEELASILDTNKSEDTFTPISTVVHIINIYDEMQQYQQNILDLQIKDQERANRTRKGVLVGIAVTFTFLIAILVFLNSQDITWREIRVYPILGIPMGIVVWSFIGSFAAMLTQFYQKPVYEFGNTLKWVIIRPVLGVVMGAAVYLALYSLVLSPANSSSLLPLLVAFFVGYSDTFTFDILNTIQRTITGMFSANRDDSKGNAQAVYMLPPANNPLPVAPTAPPVHTTPAPTVPSTKLDLPPDITLPNHNAGEDE